MRKYLLLFLLILIPFLYACQKEVPVSNITLNKTQLELAEGETFRLEATVNPPDASNTSVTWASSAPDVAKVENGLVTALKKGEATITVTSLDGSKTATCKVQVTKTVQGITLNKTQLELAEGETFRLEATVNPPDASNTSVTWASSAPDVAKVENGLVTALKKGEATITAKSHDGKITASCNIIVNINNSFDGPSEDEEWDW